MGAPAEVTLKQLRELHIKLNIPPPLAAPAPPGQKTFPPCGRSPSPECNSNRSCGIGDSSGCIGWIRHPADRARRAARPFLSGQQSVSAVWSLPVIQRSPVGIQRKYALPGWPS